MRRARILASLAALGAAVTITTPALAGAVSRPDFHDLGRCAPDVTHIELTTGSEAYFAFSVPADCAPQTWDLYFEDLAGNGGKDLPAEGRREIGRATVTLPYVDTDTGDTVAAWEQLMPYVGQAPCGAQLDLVLRGDDSPYAANVIEGSDCTPPTLEAAQPREALPPVTGVPSPPAVPGDVPPSSPPPGPSAGTPAAGGDEVPFGLASAAAPQVEWSSVTVDASGPDRAALPNTGADHTAGGLQLAGCLLGLGGLAWWFGERRNRKAAAR